MFSSLAASLAALLTMGPLVVPGPQPAQPQTPVHPGATTAPQRPGTTRPGPVLGVPGQVHRPAPIGLGASTTVAPPAQQMAEARKMAGLFKQAQQTLSSLRAAEKKLQPQAKGRSPLPVSQRLQLTSAIDQAIAQLRQIRASVPYDDLQQQLYRTTTQLKGNAKLPTASLQPLASAVQANKVYLQPQLVSKVGEAQKALKAGDEQRAALELKNASDALYDDIALRPIDDALAHLTAAQKALRTNDTSTALQKLHGANQIADQLKLEAPLVPVRFELRAAAQAADKHQHHQAQTLVQDAGDQLHQLRGTLATWQYRAQLDPMIARVAKLRAELDAGKTPSGSTLSSVAQQATAFRYDESFRKEK